MLFLVVYYSIIIMSCTYFKWICTLQLPECQGTTCSKQVQYLKLDWIWTHNHLVCKWTLNVLSKLVKWLSCVVWCIWLCVIIMSYKFFRVNSRFESCCCHLSFRHCVCFEQGVPWHSGNCRVQTCSHTCIRHDILHSQMHRTDKYSQHSSIIWVFVYKLSDCGLEPHCYTF